MADEDFDAVIRRVDPDRWLSTRFIAEPARRSDVLALYAFDQELSRAGRVTSNTFLAEIRLTWWREALDEIFAGGAVRYHPAAAALTDVIRRHGLPRAPLDAMIDGRIQALGLTVLTLDQAVRWSGDVAGSASTVAALVLDPKAPASTTCAAGALWGLSTLARSGQLDPREAAEYVASRLPIVSRAATRLSPSAFPAVAHATLARRIGRAKTHGPTEARARIIFAVMTGRL